MTKAELKEVLDRVLTWQADVACMVERRGGPDNSALRLSDEQAAEVRRRLAKPSPQTIATEELFERFRSS